MSGEEIVLLRSECNMFLYENKKHGNNAAPLPLESALATVHNHLGAVLQEAKAAALDVLRSLSLT